MRTFEVMGSGNFLLTNRIDTIEEFFLDKVHCALYSTPEEMIDVAQFYLAHESERNAIAEAGYQETKARHKIADRVRVILDTVMKPKEALCK